MKLHCFVQILQFLTLFLSPIQTQYVYTQSGDIINFKLNTQQLPKTVNLGENFRSSQQFSIWGWFRYQGNQPNITNLLNLQHYHIIDRTDTSIQPYPNPSFPSCPYTSDEIKNIPNLASSEQVMNNPNCTPQKLDTTQIPASDIKTKDQDVLFINVDHNPPQGRQNESFNFVFLIQNGQKQDQGDMFIDGFVDIQELKDNWAFFGFSCDYSKNIATIYLKIFNQNPINVFQKNIILDFPRFALKSNSEIILAAVENNSYFDSVSGFVGQTAHIEMSAFYTVTLNSLWMGYLRPSSFGYKGILMDVNFDIYQESNNTINTKGSIEKQIKIEGDYEPVFDVDRNRIGSRFKFSSYSNIGQLQFQNNESLIRSIIFFFKLSYQEPLPKQITLLEKGEKFTNGYLRISLLSVENGRSLQIELTGDPSSKQNTYVFRGDTVFPSDKLFYIIAGVSIAPSGLPRIIYGDNSQATQFSLIPDNFFYTTEPQDIYLFSPNENQKYSGYVDLFRFMVFDTASQAVQLQQRLNAIENQKFNFLDDCGLRASYYFKADDCIECQVKVLSVQNICVDYCQEFFKNPLTNQCFACTEKNCDEIDKTTWVATRMGTQHYRFKPTRKILNPYYDYQSKVDVLFDSSKKYNYDLSTVINKDEQYIDFLFKFKDRIVDQKLLFEINEDDNNKMFDQNRNLIFQGTDKITDGVNVNTVTEGICWMTDSKSKALKTLAAIALIFIAACAAILLIMTLFCCCGMYNILDLWKFLLHNWMRLQLIAFLILIGIYQPCCVQEFLDVIYKYAVSWDHAFRRVIHNANWGSDNYREGVLNVHLPQNFTRNSVSPFLIHNMLVFMIVQGAILFLYIILKIWDFIVSTSASCFYKIFVFFEFTLLIVGYLLVHMQAFVFSFLDFKKARFSHGFFVISFLFAIGYIVIFAIVWIFTLFKLVGDLISFQDLRIRDKYYYFFAGYKDSKWVRTWDHWMTFSHLIVGLMLGIFLYNPIAQTVVILCMLLFLLAITILLRPWIYGIFTLCEVIAQILIIFVVILMLVIAAFDHRKCYVCGDREGALCWLIVISLFLAIVLPLLGLLFQTIMSFFKRNDVQEIVGDEEEMMAMKKSNQHTSSKIINENITIKNVNYDETNENMTMNQFMDSIRNQGGQNMDLIGRSPNELAPDSVDEEYTTSKIMQAITANQSFNSEIEESRVQLENKEYELQRNKQNFYENKMNSQRMNSDENIADGIVYDNDRVRTSQVINSRTTNKYEVRKSY